MTTRAMDTTAPAEGHGQAMDDCVAHNLPTALLDKPDGLPTAAWPTGSGSVNGGLPGRDPASCCPDSINKAPGRCRRIVSG